MEFGIMFFSNAGSRPEAGKYDLVLAAAQFADTRGFSCVWTPERHFHEFGGLFPNPAVISAGLAVATRHLQIRAGSLISPLHHTLRIAEDWSIVDNLSRGRVAVSFGAGWNVDDFLFFPDRYSSRQAVMYDQIEAVRHFWRGGELVQENAYGKPVQVRLYPKPVQAELPVWITSSGNRETFVSAGRYGANLLTHLIGQDLSALADKIESYREALREAYGEDAQGKVSLMLHTYLGQDLEEVRTKVCGPFREYLRSALSLERLAAEGGGVISGGHRIENYEIHPDDLEELLDLTFERYFKEGSLIGTPASCERFVRQLQDLGVDEIACLVDFLDDPVAILEGLSHLDRLRATFAPAANPGGIEISTSFLDVLEKDP